MKTIIYTVLGLAVLTPTFANANIYGISSGYEMMGYGYGCAHFFMIMIGIVWTVVGILAGVWLWKNINKK